METRRFSAASVSATAALAVVLLLLVTTVPRGAAGYSTITIYSGPGCSGSSTTYECGYHQIPVHGGFRIHYDEGFPVLILRFPGRGDGRRALLSPATTRYVRDAESCDIPDRHYAQMSC
ncbi:hypothetical protein Taro_008078 [Colocasia esculenta]|uniref:Uncharacterized protein n=1 Tax=Colocasia esculenta TaxID=4460 RepID=A0A843U5W0_COLES|nr:hypothetical protein [Colocasia esculenta]